MPLPPHLADFESRIRSRFDGALADLRRQYEARLRQASEETIATLAAVRPTAELDDLFAGTSAAELERGPRGAGRGEALDSLLESVRALDRAGSQSAVLEALLSGVCRFASRAGLLLVREDRLIGWGSAGFGGDPFSGRDLAWDDDLFGALGSGRGVERLDGNDARRLTARLGANSSPDEAALVPLVLRDRVAAALYAEASAPERLELAAVQLLAAAAADRIELQALSDRTWTPTLYLAEQAQGPGLPRWDAAVIGAAAAPPSAPAMPPPAAFAPIPASAPTPAPRAPQVFEPEPVREAPRPAVEPMARPVDREPRAEVEELFAVAPSEPLEEVTEMPAVESSAAAWTLEPEPVGLETWSPAAASEAEALEIPEPVAESLDDSLWGAAESEVAADQAGFAIESEAEPAPPSEPQPRFEAAPPLGEATVRIPVYRPESAPPPAEPPAPPAIGLPASAGAIEETSGALGFSGSSTQEVPRLESTAPIPTRPPVAPPPSAPDLTEDATVLVRRGPSPAPPNAPAAPAPAAAEPEEDLNERTAVRGGGGKSTEVAPPPDVRGPGLAFAAGRTARATGENALHDEAKRLARLLVSEIKLYNEEQVLEGRRNRDLYVRLREDIDRSRQIYDERVHESVRTGSDYFHQELVRSLAGGDARALGM